MAQLNSLIVTGDSRFLNTINGDITGNAKTVNGHTVDSNVPSNAAFTDTHRVIKVDGTQVLANNTTALNLISGNNISISGNSNGNITINAGTWSSSVTGAVGSTSVTISDSNITTSSTIIPFCENNSGTSIPFTSISVSTNSIILSFSELTEVTSFKLLII